MGITYEQLKKMMDEVPDDVNFEAQVIVETEQGLVPVESVRVADADFEAVEVTGTLVLVIKKG